MLVKTLYKTVRDDGGVTVSPNKPEDEEYITLLRLIADEGKLLTQNGTDTCSCVDADTSEGWYEVDDSEYYAHSNRDNEETI